MDEPPLIPAPLHRAQALWRGDRARLIRGGPVVRPVIRAVLSIEMFVQGVIGYAIRTTGFTDQFVYRAEAGLLIPSFTAIGLEVLFDIHVGLGLSIGADLGLRGTNLPIAVPVKLALSYQWDA